MVEFLAESAHPGEFDEGEFSRMMMGSQVEMMKVRVVKKSGRSHGEKQSHIGTYVLCRQQCPGLIHCLFCAGQ